MKVNIKLLDERATPMTYGTEYSAGADLYSLKGESITINPGCTVLVHTGIAMEIPEGTVGLIFARSGLALLANYQKRQGSGRARFYR